LIVSYIQDLNLDIAPDGTAFATISSAPSGAPALYSVDLTNGNPTLLGSLQTPLSAFAVVPSSTVTLADAVAAATEGGPAVLTVTRSGSLSSSSTVSFSTADGSAGHADYTPSSGVVTFAPDEATKQITIPTTADSLDEADESFSVTLSSPGALTTLGSPAAATVTIANSATGPDKTPPSVTLSGVPASISRTALLKGLAVGVTPSEPATLTARLQGTVSKVHLSAFNLSLATSSLGLAGGKRTLTLKPKRALIGKPKRKLKLRLLVTATDAAGNSATKTRTITLKPSKPKTKRKRG
jgi:Calx-beta domain